MPIFWTDDPPQIDLHCPTCQHTWRTETIVAGVWWARGVTPAAIAAGCWCPNCRHAPPMLPTAAAESLARNSTGL